MPVLFQHPPDQLKHSLIIVHYQNTCHCSTPVYNIGNYLRPLICACTAVEKPKHHDTYHNTGMK